MGLITNAKGPGDSSTIDPRVYANTNWNYHNALDVFNPKNNGFNAYTDQQGTGPAGYGEFVAPPSDATKLGSAIVTGDWGYPGAMNVGKSAMDSATGGATGLLNYRPTPLVSPTADAAWSGNYSPAPVETAAAPTLTAPHGFSGAAINRGDIGNVTPQSGLMGLDKYMNPYTSNVIDASLNDLNRARQLGISQNASNATLSNAFGGDRQAVTDAETNRGYLDAAGRTIAGLRNQGFDTAAGLLQNDQAKNLQGQLANQGVDLNVANTNTGYGQQANMFNANAANQGEQFGAGLIADLNRYNAGAFNQGNQFNAANLMANNQFNAGNRQQINLANQNAAMQGLLANQNADLSGAQLDLSSAGLLGNLSNDALSNYLRGGGAVLGVGAAEDSRQQAYRDALYQEFLRQQGLPFQRQEAVNQSLGLLPASGGTNNYNSSQLGTRLNNATSAVNFMSKFMDMFGGLAASDADLKTDIETVRRDGRGRRWVNFRYLWDAPGTVRHGVIAQEILASDPDAVVRDPNTGFLFVDYAKLTEAQ